MAFVAISLLTLFFLAGTFVLAALVSIYRSLPKGELKKLTSQVNRRFFYRKIHAYFFPEKEYQGLFFAVTCAHNVTRFILIALLSLWIFLAVPFETTSAVYIYFAFTLFAAIFLTFLLTDYIPRIAGTSYPAATFNFSTPAASLFMTLSLPIIYPFLKLTRLLPDPLYFDYLHEPEAGVKQEIIEIIQEAKLTEQLDANEKKLLSSLLSFCEHLAREVMVPRVDLFCLEANTSIRDAIKELQGEGYSRVPIFQDNVDKISGILMYKDLLSAFRRYIEEDHNPTILDAPISSIQKPPLYTPETKKISELLQEFRKKQVHMAIVVDEYGGTEGIVTIEDILEDIVGEIIDEYDDEEELFLLQSDGSWVVDPRMSILDAEEQLNIRIPQEGEYDTIGGYIFQCAGEIPSRGFTISSDLFDLEVLRSSDRSIEKVKIKPRDSKPDEGEEGNTVEDDGEISS